MSHFSQTLVCKSCLRELIWERLAESRQEWDDIVRRDEPVECSCGAAWRPSELITVKDGLQEDTTAQGDFIRPANFPPYTN
jgi:hypothetical protein